MHRCENKAIMHMVSLKPAVPSEMKGKCDFSHLALSVLPESYSDEPQ
jgi:hypothetical protein